MTESTQAGGQGWDGVVLSALNASGVDATLTFASGALQVAIPFGLPALMGALLHCAAPEAPRKLRIFTWDLVGIGAVVELQHTRPLTALPEALVALAANIGVNVRLHRQTPTSSVLLTLPVES